METLGFVFKTPMFHELHGLFGQARRLPHEHDAVFFGETSHRNAFQYRQAQHLVLSARAPLAVLSLVFPRRIDVKNIKFFIDVFQERIRRGVVISFEVLLPNFFVFFRSDAFETLFMRAKAAVMMKLFVAFFAKNTSSVRILRAKIDVISERGRVSSFSVLFTTETTSLLAR